MQTLTSKLGQSESLASLGFLRSNMDEESQRIFVLQSGLCLQCGRQGKIREHEEETVCEECGTVWSNMDAEPEQAIPFSEQSGEAHSEGNYNPTSELVFGHNLGCGTPSNLKLYRILAKGPSGRTDVGLRACQVRVLTSKVDPPAIETLLAYGSKLCEAYGLHSNEDSAAVFADVLGRQLRKVGAWYVLRGQSERELRKVASAMFYDLYRQRCQGFKEEEKLMVQLKITPEILSFTRSLLAALTFPKKEHHQKVSCIQQAFLMTPEAKKVQSLEERKQIVNEYIISHSEKSDRQIGRDVGVNHATVSRWRRQLSLNGTLKSPESIVALATPYW